MEENKRIRTISLEDDLNDYVAEGVEAMVPYKGTVTDILKQLTGGVRSVVLAVVGSPQFLKCKILRNLSKLQGLDLLKVSLVTFSLVDNFLSGIASNFLVLSKRTIIGLVVGTAIIGIGFGNSLISDIGFQTVNVDETFGVGESTSYQISANDGARQHMKITGDKFDLKLSSPGLGLQIPKEGDSPVTHRKEVTLDWVHLEDEFTRIYLQNVGSSEMHIEGSLTVTTDQSCCIISLSLFQEWLSLDLVWALPYEGKGLPS